jgi:hypothetical protein
MKRILAIAGVALLGIGVAVGVTMAAAQLSSQSIGISEEPVTAGERLVVTTPSTSTRPRPRTATVARPSRPAPSDPAATVVTDDHGGGDRSGSGGGVSGGDDGSGRGRGGGDD